MDAPSPTLHARAEHRGEPSWRNRAGRWVWGWAALLLMRPSPRRAFAFRAGLLRLFGARLGRGCHIYPGARIWAPWNLVCGDRVAIADEAVVYNAAPVRLDHDCVISQQAYLCTASHALDDERFEMVARPITIGARAWVCARACIGPGVQLGDGAVLGLAAVATSDLLPWTVYAGHPAMPLRPRRRISSAP
jgi:putative colanic acid biosynthesis acetyltransferase WcaF